MISRLIDWKQCNRTKNTSVSVFITIYRESFHPTSRLDISELRSISLYVCTICRLCRCTKSWNLPKSPCWIVDEFFVMPLFRKLIMMRTRSNATKSWSTFTRTDQQMNQNRGEFSSKNIWDESLRALGLHRQPVHSCIWTTLLQSSRINIS